MKRLITIATCVALALMTLTGCGTGAKQNVATEGSTSVERLIGALGEAFTENNSNVNFTYSPTGSSSGISAVAEGRCDIGLSSRALKAEEKAMGLQETLLAYDGIAIIVNNGNPVSNITSEQLAKIYTGEINNWREIGGSDLEIVVIGREAGSGTRDGFESITNTKDKCAYRQELTSTGDVIATVSSNPNAIGYTSLASVKDSVKAVEIDGVAPSEETVRDGSYAIWRPFMLVTRTDKPLSEAAQAFFDYAISEETRSIMSLVGVVYAN